MPRLTESRRRDRREQISSAALRCFSARGFADTSMADIIKESGLSAGSIYSHFESKADLMRFVAADVLESRTWGLEPDTTPAALIRALLRPIDCERAKLLLQLWAEAPRDAELAALVQENIAAVRSRVNSLDVNDQDVRELTGTNVDANGDAVIAAIHGYVVLVALDPGAHPETLLAGITDLLGS